MKKYRHTREEMDERPEDPDAFAPNAGPSDQKQGYGQKMKRTAEYHGDNMGMFGHNDTGAKVSTAHTKEWGAMPYSQHTMSDGSMDYESVKHSEAGRDATRLKKHSKVLINRD